MRAIARRHSATFVVAFLTALVTAGGPPLAAVVFDADNARNADRVDGKHAVGAGATVNQRAQKLLATNGAGRFPNNVIAKAPDADELDGVNGAAFQRRVKGTCPANQAIRAVAAGGGVTCALDDIDVAHVVPVSAAGTAQQNGTALRNALAGIPTSGANRPTAAAPWLVRIGPGTFDLSGATLVTRAFVHIEGSGAATLVTCACGSTASPTMRIAHPVDVRSLAVRATVSGESSAVALVVAASARLVDVSAEAIGGSIAYGMVFTAGESRVLHSETSSSTSDFSGDSTALWANGGSVAAEGLTASAAGLGGFIFGIYVQGQAGETVEITGARVVASGGEKPNSAPLYRVSGVLRVADSLIDGGVVPSGLPSACVGAYDASFTLLDGSCRTIP